MQWQACREHKKPRLPLRQAGFWYRARLLSSVSTVLVTQDSLPHRVQGHPFHYYNHEPTSYCSHFTQL